MYVKVDSEGTASRYTIGALRRDNPDVSFADQPAPDALAEFGVYPVAATEQPALGEHQLVSEGAPELVEGEWRQTWIVSDIPIADRKEAMRLAINARRDQAFAAGFTVAGTGTALDGHTLQTRDDNDKINWLTSQAAYSAQIAAGNGAVVDAEFRTAANDTITVSFSDGLTVLLAMAGWGKAIMGNSWALKDAVDAASDRAALDPIDKEAGWP